MIKYENVDLCQQELTILRDISLEFYAGEFTYLLGKVGSGKSTLKSLYKEVQIAKGEAEVLSYDLVNMKTARYLLRRKIGIVFQDFQLLIDRTVTESGICAAGNRVDEQKKPSMSKFNLSDSGWNSE